MAETSTKIETKLYPVRTVKIEADDDADDRSLSGAKPYPLSTVKIEADDEADERSFSAREGITSARAHGVDRILAPAPVPIRTLSMFETTTATTTTTVSSDSSNHNDADVESTPPNKRKRATQVRYNRQRLLLPSRKRAATTVMFDNNDHVNNVNDEISSDLNLDDDSNKNENYTSDDSATMDNANDEISSELDLDDDANDNKNCMSDNSATMGKKPSYSDTMWEAYFQLLVKYKSKHGTTRVPKK